MAGRPKKGDELTLTTIIEASWKIVERSGLSSLTTRSLAAELNVKSPALYWHIESKDQLLALMLENIVSSTIVTVPQELSWWEWLLEVARVQRRNLLSRRDSGVIASSVPPSDRMRNKVFPDAIEPLLRAGFSRDEAAKVFGGVVYCVMGAVIYEQREQTLEFLKAYNDPEDTFEFVISSYIEGVRRVYTPRFPD